MVKEVSELGHGNIYIPDGLTTSYSSVEYPISPINNLKVCAFMKIIFQWATLLRNLSRLRISYCVLKELANTLCLFPLVVSLVKLDKLRIWKAFYVSMGL